MTSHTPSFTTAVTVIMTTLLSLTLLVGCGDQIEPANNKQAAPGVFPTSGLVASVLFETQGRPTQLIALGEDRYLIAEFEGDEDDQKGSVTNVQIDGNNTDQTKIYQGLDKPTGIAVAGNDLYIMERRRLSRGSLDGADPTILQDNMAFNGRSQGTLTYDATGRLFFNTSGDIEDGSVVTDSGILWTLNTNQPEDKPEPYATGFKNAYAHHVDNEGRLWVTEINDGTFDDQPGQDKVALVPEGANNGWPQCVDDNRPVAEYEGSKTTCANTITPHTLFDPGATPTSITTSPWDDNTLLVALWVEGRIVAVDKTDPDKEPVDVVTGIERPQHLVADGDRLLIVDHTNQRVLAVEQS